MMKLFARRRTAFAAGAITIAASTLVSPNSASAEKTGAPHGETGLEALKQSDLLLSKMKSFRILSKATQGGKTEAETIEVMPIAKRLRRANAVREFVVTPEGAYEKRNGKWLTMPGDMSQIVGHTGLVSPSDPKRVVIKRLGRETWHGIPANLISQIGTYTKSDCKVWLRASNGVPLHIETTIIVPKQAVAGKADTKTHTTGNNSSGKITYVADYDYKTPVTITAPVVK